MRSLHVLYASSKLDDKPFIRLAYGFMYGSRILMQDTNYVLNYEHTLFCFIFML